MAPNKFEQQLKEQFNEREIQPSKDSWSRLNSRLSIQKESNRNSFFWYSIAASFIGLLIISVLYFNKGNDQNNAIQVVESADENSHTPEIVTPNVFVEKNSNDIVNKTQDHVEKIAIVQEEESVVAATKNNDFVKGASIIENLETKIELSDSIMNTKITEVIAHVNALEIDAGALTDAEVDSLLRNAQKEIFGDKILNQGNSVDALAMLNEVEEDLDQSFRNKVFESLKRKFIKAKTAVADRNN